MFKYLINKKLDKYLKKNELIDNREKINISALFSDYDSCDYEVENEISKKDITPNEEIKEKKVLSKTSFEKTNFITCACDEVDDFINENKDNITFTKLLFNHIDKLKLKDSDVYKKVNIDRRLFSKLRNEDYHPSRNTVLLLGFALKLNENKIEELLESASYSLPKTTTRDLIIRFCVINKIYNIHTINQLLFDHNCDTLN